MDYLIYDPKQKQWGSVLQKQRIKDNETYYQINFDNKLKAEDEPNVRFYDKDLNLIKLYWEIHYINDDNQDDWVGKDNCYNPKEAYSTLNKTLKELSKNGFEIVDYYIKVAID